MLVDDIFSFYKRIFLRHPYVTGTIVVIYVFSVIAFVSRRSVVQWLRAPGEVAELRMRVLDLETQRRQQDQLLSTLAERTSQAEFLKPLKFEETWRDERAKQTVGRLVEYAEFAISKNDFEHAQRFYTEANEVQPTLTVPYYEGRLAYRRGDLQRAETKWLEAIKRDPGRRYPDLRLYLGVLYYQTGRLDEAKAYLGSYAGAEAKR